MLNRLTKFIQSIAKPAATLPDGPVFRSPEHHAYISQLVRGAVTPADDELSADELSADDKERMVAVLEEMKQEKLAKIAKLKAEVLALRAENIAHGIDNSPNH